MALCDPIAPFVSIVVYYARLHGFMGHNWGLMFICIIYNALNGVMHIYYMGNRQGLVWVYYGYPYYGEVNNRGVLWVWYYEG